MKLEKGSLGGRMKGYEQKYYLPPNIPVIIRLDGRAFHTLTRKMQKPFDINFIIMMNIVGEELCKEIQGCKLAYLQSDEISFLILNNPDADTWFGNEIQKMCSISASIASVVASKRSKSFLGENTNISFDSRAFIIPKEDVVNYFIWRQNDWERNSLSMFAREYFSQKELDGKKAEDIHEMLLTKDQNWNDLQSYLKRGRCIIKEEQKLLMDNQTVVRHKWKTDYDIPIFTESREYITERLK